MAWNPMVLDKIKEEYRFDASLKTLKTGRLIAFAAVIVIAYFAYIDVNLLQLEHCLHWRFVGWIGFAIFLLGSFTFLKQHTNLIIPFYSVALAGLLVMMTGIVYHIFVVGGTPEQKVAIIVGFMSVWFLVALISFGAGKMILYSSGLILLILIYVLNQTDEPDKGFLLSIILVGIFANIIIYIQEKNEFQKFQFIKELELNKNTLSNQKSELEILNKELESFNYSISHDLRTPLRIANSYAQLLDKKLSKNKDEETEEYLNFITGGIRKMNDLINDLLNLSKIGKKILNSEKIDTKSLVEEVVHMNLSQYKNKDVELIFEELPTVIADKVLITQVFSNLIGNAFKYTSKKEKAIIEIGSYFKKEFVVFYVKDNGAGFNMNYYDKLFQVFKRLHDETEFEGTGIGLAIVDRIIKYHSGTIWAQSEEGKGATFFFTLPKEARKIKHAEPVQST